MLGLLSTGLTEVDTKSSSLITGGAGVLVVDEGLPMASSRTVDISESVVLCVAGLSGAGNSLGACLELLPATAAGILKAVCFADGNVFLARCHWPAGEDLDVDGLLVRSLILGVMPPQVVVGALHTHTHT